MNLLNRLFGQRHDRQNEAERSTALHRNSFDPGGQLSSTDYQAIQRYQYLLRTAPPEAIEAAHEEAFAQLTPEQRRLALQSLNSGLPPHERASRDDAHSLARMATRSELRRPGTLERTFGGTGIGIGGLVAVDLLSTIAGVVVGTAIAEAFFDNGDHDQGNQDGAESADADQGAGSSDGDHTGDDDGFNGAADFGDDFGGGEF